MKATICKKVYDTEKSTLVKKVTFGAFGDENGYEESLYVTADGCYFMYENGGKTSIHPEEKIKRMSKATADEWVKKNA